jgi:thiosulfate/3-mercaptopyruvate sulfurtransferase
LPDPATFGAWLGKQGLNPGDTVVCYDQGSGALAARLWWMLRWIGHDSVAVLDGGIAKWRKENRPTTAEVPQVAPTTYPVKPRAGMAVNVGYVQSNLGKALLLDARSPQRYRGESEPIDPVAGRIPGALNRSNSDNLSPDGVFKQPEELRKDFLAVLGGRQPGEVVNYCGSGVSATHNALAMEIAGLTGSRLYAGSWSEWIADPGRPQEKG